MRLGLVVEAWRLVGSSPLAGALNRLQGNEHCPLDKAARAAGKVERGVDAWVCILLSRLSGCLAWWRLWKQLA